MGRHSRTRKRKPYRYQPLPDSSTIRLLLLQPGKASNRVQCRLFHASIDDYPDYEAISYVWGDPKDKTHVLCHGKLVKIPMNLLHSLQRLRDEKKPRVLWADSICINQKDQEERAQQVRMMGSIFEGAVRVLVWFGRGLDFDVKAAVDFIKALSPRTPSWENWLSDEDAAEYRLFAESLPSFQWKAFSELVNNPWQRRLWVVQEVGLAREGLVICGDEVISWNHLTATLVAIFRYCHVTADNYGFSTTKLSAIRRTEFQDCNLSLASILERARNFECSDPRDKVYGLLGHHSFRDSAQTRAESIPVDYTISVSDVYLNTAKYLLGEPSPLHTLSAVLHTHKTLTDRKQYISWVPRWDIPFYGLPLGTVNLYKSGGPTRHFVLQQGQTLEIEGLYVDSIVWTSAIMNWADVPAERKEKENPLTRIWETVKGFKQMRSSGYDLFVDFCSTLTAGTYIGDVVLLTAETSSEQRVADGAAYFEEVGLEGPTCSDLSRHRSMGQPDRFINSTTPIHCRRFFITEKGYLGLGPEVAEVGDEISVFLGAKVPSVLRPQESGDFRLCGDCYVHGLMDGEAITMWENGELEKRSFTLT